MNGTIILYVFYVYVDECGHIISPYAVKLTVQLLSEFTAWHSVVILTASSNYIPNDTSAPYTALTLQT